MARPLHQVRQHGPGGRRLSARARVTDDERRRRLVVRHHLVPAARAGSVEQVAASVVGLHATDPASVHLAAAARLAGPPAGAVAAVERALYDDRSLLRMLGMRRTMFVVPLDLAAVVQAGATAAVAARERRRLVDLLERAGVAPAGDGGRWLDATRAAALAALDERGEATGAELSKAVPALATKVTYAEGKAYGGEVSLTSQILNGLGADAAIVRGRPKGTWLSSQHRWAATARWLGAPLPALDGHEARVELVRRWLAAFGPATAADVQWWTGWGKRDTATVLAAVDVEEVDLDAGPGLRLAGDDGRDEPAAPAVALLPALDPTTMGWFARDWYLDPELRPALFDRNGNAGPTVWLDGRIVGGWATPAPGEVAVRLLVDVDGDARRALDVEVERTVAALGGARVVPKFRTPLERELAT